MVTAGNGTIYIPKEMRDRFGEKFHLIERNDRIILFPVSEDPLSALRDEMSGIEKSVDEIKKEALESVNDENK